MLLARSLGENASVLTVSNLSVGRGHRDLFTDVSFSVGAGERIAILGPNGSGKSTLIECLAGRLRPRSGSVSRNPPDLAVGYLEQSQDVASSAATVGELLDADVALQEGLAAAAERLAASPHDPKAEAAYAAALERLTTAQGADGTATLADWNLAELDPAMAVDQLSGGQKQKLALARLLADRPDFLLLDEPTNHLDAGALDRLAEVLLRFPGGVLLVSHDRAFLDQVATAVLAVDPASGTLARYAGNYTAYAERRARERERQSALFRSEQAEMARMRRDIARTREQARQVETSTTPRNPNVRRLAKKVARKASSREKKLERYRDDPARTQRPTDGWRLKVEFGDAAGGDRALALQRLAVGYDGRPPVLEEVTVDLGRRERVALQGPNGSGKTTLLRTLAGDLLPAAGRLRTSAAAVIGYMAQEQETLDPCSTPLGTILAECAMSETDARSFLHFFLFSGDDPLQPIAELSFGERARLSLALLVARGATVLLLDEPLNHLDLDSRERFETALGGFGGAVVVASHDRYFVERFACTVWELRPAGSGRHTLVVAP